MRLPARLGTDRHGPGTARDVCQRNLLPALQCVCPETASAQYGSAAPADHARCHVQWRHPDLSGETASPPASTAQLTEW